MNEAIEILIKEKDRIERDIMYHEREAEAANRTITGLLAIRDGHQSNIDALSARVSQIDNAVRVIQKEL